MNKTSLKRIYGEISRFDVETSNYVLEKKDTNYYLKIAYLGDTYEFKLLKTYPFCPPILYINGYEYLNLMHKYWNSFDKFYNTKKCCICEKTILCGNKWSPAYKIKDIINETDQFKILFKTIYKIKYIKPLLKKYYIFEEGIINKIKEFVIL
tara:strand:+ start:189 stop:644 length:456 start_codon:yes stop_codon:yes gene_type:complete